MISAFIMYLGSVTVSVVIMSGEGYSFILGVTGVCIQTLLFLDYLVCLYLVSKMEKEDKVIKYKRLTLK